MEATLGNRGYLPNHRMFMRLPRWSRTCS